MAKKRRRGAPRRLIVRSMPRMGGGRALEVDGVVQSVTVDDGARAGSGPQPGQPGPDGGYWGLLVPARCPRRALLLGLGGGTVAALLARRCPGVALVGVEHDETVLALARTEFDLDAIPGLSIVVADAFRYAAEQSEAALGSFDLICLDLFEGGRLAPGALATAFLRQLAALLTPDGLLAVNLIATGRLSEQLHRLQRVFAVERELRVRGNVVLHLRALPAAAAEA